MDRTERIVRRGLAGVGAVIALVALLPELRNVQEIAIGRSQWLLLGLALVLIALALLGPRRWDAYRATALILLNTLITLVVVEAGSTGALRLLGQERDTGPPELGTARSNPYFADADWADAFWSEELASWNEVYHPYTVWRTAPFQGQFVVVDEDGLRHTPGAECTDDAYRVALFGGSALWGWGVPDDQTVPAWVQRKLSERMARPVCVLNRGQNAYVSTQDLVELMRMVQAGERIDLAIFHNGFNDAAAIHEAGPGVHYSIDVIRDRMGGVRRGGEQPTIWTSLGKTATGRLLSRITRPAVTEEPTPWTRDEIDSASRDVLRSYLANAEIARQLGSLGGFEVAFFWQPYADWGTPSADAGARPGPASYAGREALVASVYSTVRTGVGTLPDVHFLADEFVHVAASDWLDWVHLAPAGNERVADLMLDALTDRLPE